LKGIPHRRAVVSLAAAALTFGASSAAAATASAASINGAGSTLVQPLVSEWTSGFSARTGISVNYQGVGSGTGIADISHGLVDFGASDAPMTPSQAAGCGGCVQIPWALSATGVGYNLPRRANVRLTGPVLAGIYLGQITSWGAKQIIALNPKLPAADRSVKITPVFRSDGSGDTYAFTNYLQSVNSTWRAKVGHGTSVAFPTGASGKGNSGVASVVESTPGAIGYIAVAYLIGQHLPAAAVKNAAGKYEYPNLSNIENAAQSSRIGANNAISIVNPARRFRIAYPISTFTYAIVKPGLPNNALVKQFIKYALGPGKTFGANIDFAPLPMTVRNADTRAVSGI
jgi:phosphate transport system substrate-binding protein